MALAEQTIWRPQGTQVVAYTATAAATSNAVSEGVYAVRLVVSSDAHYAIGKSPTATTSDALIPAGVVEIIRINPGEKVSFIQNAAGGNGYVTEMV